MDILKYKKIGTDVGRVYAVQFFLEDRNRYIISDYSIASRVGYEHLVLYQDDMKTNYGAKFYTYNDRRITAFDTEEKAKKAVEYLEARYIAEKLRGTV